MDDNGIMDVKNSVGTGFGPGKDVLYALATKETSVYRVTGMDQIHDIIECGYVRPKGYGTRAERVGNRIYWATGNDKLYYLDKRPVIEASCEKVIDGQIGAISINDLTAIWIFNEQLNKYVNNLEYIKELHEQAKTSIEEEKTMTK